MSILNGQEVAAAYHLILDTIKERLDKIPFRRLKDLRPDEIEDFVSDYHMELAEVDFDNAICRDIADARGQVYNHFDRCYVEVNGRKLTYDALIRHGAEYITYSPAGGAESFYLGPLADRHFEKMNLTKDSDGHFYVSFSLFVPEDHLKGQTKEDLANLLSQKRKEYLEGTLQRISHLNSAIDSFNKDMVVQIKKMITEKIEHDALTEDLLGAVGVQLVPKNSDMQQGQKIEIAPKKLHSPLSSPEAYDGYYIDETNYKAIMETIRQHLVSTEIHPLAIQELKDEELIRDTILWALDSTYFIANGEAFRQGGKADISIVYKDKSAFVAECKIWHGGHVIGPAIDQLFGYTTWRDSKACIIIFNLEVQDFDKVCTEALEAARKHPAYKRVIRIGAKNDFVLSYQDSLNPNSCIEVSFLIANYVKR